MGQGLGAVLPVVVVGIVADLLVNLLLGLEIVGLDGARAVVTGEGGLRGCHRNQEQWIQSEQAHSVNFSDRTISFSGNPAPETIGPRVITLKVLN